MAAWADAMVIVIDASTEGAADSEQACRDVAEHHPGATVHYVRAFEPGLTKQRNQAADLCAELDVDVIHFLDDDAEVMPGYFDAIEAEFARDDRVAGVGAVIMNAPPTRHQWFRRVFLLHARSGGRVLRSGRGVTGCVPGAQIGEKVDWLSGCCMSYLTSICREHRFDGRLRGYSPGEDLDFGFRVSRQSRLLVAHEARCLHHVSPSNRMAAYDFWRDRTILMFAWAREQRPNGISRIAFVWSVLGELILLLLAALKNRDRSSLKAPAGVMAGLKVCIQARASRDLSAR
jgi:GT2 family glycosyltransferase